MMAEINAEEELRRIKEDTLARNHQGYFKLWKMKKVDHNWNYHRGEQEWTKDELIGIFPTREPCESFVALLEGSPEVSYEFCPFNVSTDHINGYWEVEINSDSTFRMAKWHWGWKDQGPDFERMKDYCNGDRFEGHARTKERALELAREAKVVFDKFVAEERPKRAEGCYCGPWDEKPCGKCEKIETERKKKDCGCPHCEGDH